VNAAKPRGRRTNAGVAKVTDEVGDDTEETVAEGIDPLWSVLSTKTYNPRWIVLSV